MAEVDEQLRSYAEWLTELADQRAAEAAQAPKRAVASVRTVEPSERRWWPILAAAAAAAILVAGILAVGGRDEPVPGGEPDVPSDTAAVHETTVPAQTPEASRSTTTLPATTVPAATVPERVENRWTGGLLDDIDSADLRPLDSLQDGEVVVPTAPSGWRIEDSSWNGVAAPDGPSSIEWTVDVVEAPDEPRISHVLYVTQSREPVCRSSLGCVPSGATVDVNGVVWEAIGPERAPSDDADTVDPTTLRANVGGRLIDVASGAPQSIDPSIIDDPEVLEFLAGLRAGSPVVVAELGEACYDCRAGIAEGDPFAGGVPDVEDVADAAGTVAESPSLRPLTELGDGDVVIPAYLPPGMQLESPARLRTSGVFDFSFSATNDGGMLSLSVTQWPASSGQFAAETLSDPNHPPVELAGGTWGWYDFESARIAQFGPFDVLVRFSGLEPVEARRFVEGLRAGALEQYPGPIGIDDGGGGVAVIDGGELAGGEIVASDDQFEATAARVGDDVCLNLRQTTVPVTASFSPDCYGPDWFGGVGIIDLYALDGAEMTADAPYLIVGRIDDPDATAVRVIEPGGSSTVVETGPTNDVIDGRFFLAYLDIDDRSGIRVDQFVIEDASP